jgi:hypothetical protein
MQNLLGNECPLIHCLCDGGRNCSSALVRKVDMTGSGR